MRIKVTHERHGVLYGTLKTDRISEFSSVFVLYADDPRYILKRGQLVRNWPNNDMPDKYHWFGFSAPTLPDLIEEAKMRGLSDIRPA